MKLKSYINLTPDAKGCREVQIRLVGDAAPAAPFVALGDLTHEPDLDNLSGAQKYSVSHAITQHVAEQIYRQHGLQDMQKIKLTNGGAFRLLKAVYVEKSVTDVKPGGKVTLKVKLEPTNATVDGYFCKAENPALATVEDKTGGVFEITLPQDGITVIKIGVKNTDLYELVPVQAWKTVKQA